MRRPYVVALGGTLRPSSSTERALGIVLQGAAEAGAEVLMLSGGDLDLPPYSPETDIRTPACERLVGELRRADGLVLGSPGYHGGVSGLVKNAIDYVEDLRSDVRPYLEGRAVGAVATGAGWQGAVNTLSALRGIVHALRGWNTPLGVAINTTDESFAPDGTYLSPKINQMLALMGRQIVDFAQLRLQRSVEEESGQRPAGIH